MSRPRIYGEPTPTGQYPALGKLTRTFAKRIRGLVKAVVEEGYDIYDTEGWLMGEVHMAIVLARLDLHLKEWQKEAQKGRKK